MAAMNSSNALATSSAFVRLGLLHAQAPTQGNFSESGASCRALDYTSVVMMSAFGAVAGAMSARTVFVVESILLLPIILTCCFGWAAPHFQTGQTKTWSVYRGFGRFILAATVAGWWVT